MGSEIYLIKSKIKSKFEMKDLGRTKRILGMKIKRERYNYVVYLNQCSYAKKILETLSMLEWAPISLPIANHFKLSSEQLRKTD